MALSMDQAPELGWHNRGLGVAAIVGAVLGPVVTGGADAYRTFADSEQGKKELKQRRREFQSLLPIYQQQATAQERQAALTTIAALRQSRTEAAYGSSYTPYLGIAAVLGGLALVLLVTRKKGGARGD